MVSLGRTGPPKSGTRPRRYPFYTSLLDQQLRAQPAAKRDIVSAAEQCLVDLGRYLSGVLGREGYRALVQRGLKLAAGEFPTLAIVEARAQPLGRVVGLRRSVQRLPPTEVKEAVALILAESISVLTKLLGADITLRLLRQLWPLISDADLDRDVPRPGPWR